MANIFTKQFKILGRSKKLRIITDSLFLIILTVVLFFYSYNYIKRLDIKPLILNTISTISKKEKEPELKPVQEKICTLPEIQASAYYYNNFGDQLGIGPIPPIISIPTNYWIFLKITNKENPQKNIKIETSLPYNITFTGKKGVTSGNLYLLSTYKTIVWEINSLAKNDIQEAKFEISLTPTQSNIGKILLLTDNISLSSSDVICEKNTSSTIENLDTNLKYDTLGKNKGRVQSLE